MDNIQLPRPLVNTLLHQAQISPECEICGLIGALNGTPASVYPVANVADHPGELFRMDPQGQIDAMRRLREAGETLFAIYHSHPHADARPSARDLAEAAYPDALYLIISLNTEGVLEMRAFHLNQERFEPVPLMI